MLYLPAIEFAGRTIRLPCPDRAVFDLCVADPAAEEFLSECRQILRSSPSLLAFTLFSFWREKGRAAVGMEDLADWIGSQFFLDSRANAGSFEPAEPLNLEQLNRLQRWLMKPSRKRLQNFVSRLDGLEKRIAGKLLRSILSRPFEVELTATEQVGLELGENGLLSCSDSLNDPLPMAQVWRMACDIRRLRLRFDRQLQDEKLNAMKQLAYGASHEINNPLANIATRAQTLLADESSAERRNRLAVIYAQAMRAHEMISDMMLFARPPEIDPAPAEPAGLIRLVAGELQSELSTCGISVVVRQYPDVPTCEIDLTQFAVAIKALLQNSINAMGSPGEIRVQIWRRANDRVAISVTDNGPGVDPEIAGQIFDPFFSGREAGRGLGFGLSKVWRIVQLHGGDIALDPDWKQGARFVMTLPVRQNRSDSRDAASQPIDKVQAA